MKRITINQGKVGLVFKKGDYIKVIKGGTHWLGFNQTVAVYDLTKDFYTSVALEVLLQDTTLAEMLEVVEVQDNELVFMYENNNFKRVLNAGRHVFWKGFITRTFQKIDISKIEITEKVDTSLFNNYEVSKYVRTFEVAAYEKAVLLVNDTYQKTLVGGTYRFWKNETTIKIAKVDTRQLQLEVAGQELLTKDKANVRVNFYTQYKVTDIEKALLANKDYEKQLYVNMQLALRKYVGH